MRSLSHSSPHPRWHGEENQKEKAKLVGCDRSSLTKSQREKKITTRILIKRIYSMQCSHHPMLSLLLNSNPLPSASSPLKCQAGLHMV